MMASTVKNGNDRLRKGNRQRRLEQLILNLQRSDQYQDYNNIIQEQLNQGVVDRGRTRKAKWKGVLHSAQNCRQKRRRNHQTSNSV